MKKRYDNICCACLLFKVSFKVIFCTTRFGRTDLQREIFIKRNYAFLGNYTRGSCLGAES